MQVRLKQLTQVRMALVLAATLAAPFPSHAGTATLNDTLAALDDSAAVKAAQAGTASAAGAPSLLPAPAYAGTRAVGAFALSADTPILTRGKDDQLADAARYLHDVILRSTGFALSTAGADTAQGYARFILLDVDAARKATLGDEGYTLVSDPKGIVIRAASAQGVFHGVQTLLQLLPPAVYGPSPASAVWSVPGVALADWPRFGYRGAMLDVARRFFPVDDVKRYIDEIALLKYNTLHLHLTDDQGWRIAIDALPALTDIGGSTQSGFPSKAGNNWYYTAQQYADIVSYAKSRFITIVPEVDGPSHVSAAQASIANLNCNNQALAPYSGFDGPGLSLLCLTDPTHLANVKAYLHTVLPAVAAMTPGGYVHIGGDETPTGITPAQYNAYISAAAGEVATAKKTVIGWHQIGPATLTAGTLLQYWGDASDQKTIGTSSESKNIQQVRAGIKQGARFILSPADRAYVDMKYNASTPYGLSWEGYVDIQKSYGWDPETQLSSPDGKTRLLSAKQIAGVEGTLWSDRAYPNSTSLPTPSTVWPAPRVYADYMAFPRLASIAELGWSPLGTHDWNGFKGRLATQGQRWDAYGVGYYKSPEIAWQ
ncbi:beta-N-acetylhexosaminidase [Burkholderia alba]|uniref:beta-N-acetylhexosaminidase n=1 Tax=Burkholderia alba TaxID=2683677 RepID=UPI002B05B482|nr:beta-N-acetylhexosaminidase [Burkholderia alba]